MKLDHDGECKINNLTRCKTFGCMTILGHVGECKIGPLVGPRCETKGCNKLPDHDGNCTMSASVGPRCKSKGCMLKRDHEGDCTMSASIGLRCKKTGGCGRPVGHTGDCGSNSGTPGTKCSKNIGCVRWDGHGGPHRKPKYETSTTGGSSLADFKEFIDKLHDFPDDDELTPFLDEIAEETT